MKKLLFASFAILLAIGFSAVAENNAPRSVEYYLNGVGTLKTNGRAIFMFDGKRITKDEFSAIDSTKVKNININNTSSIQYILTPEEIAAGISSIIAVTSTDNKYVGCWNTISENGKPETGYKKEYHSDGTFSVLKMVEQRNANNSRVIYYEPVQSGVWNEKDGVITEESKTDDAGVSTLKCQFDGDTLIQTYNNSATPKVVKFIKENICNGVAVEKSRQ